MYGECRYEDTCYSTLVLKVNNESVLEPNTPRQPVDDVNKFAQNFTHNKVNGQPNVHMFKTDWIKVT